ncbi:uncharacterized protein [Anabrus simplex]|uniref:uncharacterized protein n=1 Tax=Anabrus simplex TaxID=316456 RepID=UPI0035A31CEA
MARQCCSPRSTIVFASLLSLVQGCIQLAVAIYGILVYKCSVAQPDLSNILQFTGVVYFLGQCRDGMHAADNFFSLIATNRAAERTIGVMSTYAALSTLWILASFILLAQAVGNKNRKAKTLHWLHYPWVGVTVACLTMDIVATILYSLDFKYTESIEDLLNYLNMKSRTIPTNEVKDLISFPTMVMVLFCSRLVVIWILNIILVTLVIRSAKDIYTAKAIAEVQKGAIAAENLPPLPSNFPHKLPRTKSASSIGTASVYSLPRLVPKDGKFTRAESDTSNQSPLHLAAIQGFSYEKSDLSQLAGVNSSITSKDGTHRRLHQDAKRPWSMLPPTMLRNQLPWSYFRSRDDPVSSPRRGVSDPNVDLPPVPVPDYTLHFQRQQQRPASESG